MSAENELVVPMSKILTISGILPKALLPVLRLQIFFATTASPKRKTVEAHLSLQ
jgi:hypothetical protein